MTTKIIVAEATKKTTKTGKEYLFVQDQVGNNYSCWEEDDWGEFIPGAELEVEITQKGDFKNIRLANKQRPARTYQPKAGIIAQAQQRKEHSIASAQDRRDEGIKIAGTMRDAVLIVVNMGDYKELDEKEIKQRITGWRKWLLEEFDMGKLDF